MKTGSALTLACLVALTGCNKDEKKTVESTFETIAPPLILPKVTSQPVILPKAADSVPLLDFGVKVGNQINSFYQQGNIATHLLMRSSAVSTSAAPRLIVAFPAGNSGTAIWFKPSDQPVDWKKQADLKGITLQDTKGRILYGIEASITPGVSKLVLDAGMLGSVRTLRSFDKNTKYAGRRDLEIEENALGLPRAAVADQVVSGNSILWIRDRLDGSAGYSMSLTVTNGYVDKSSTTGNIELIATQNEPLNLVLQSLSGETPLVPLLEADLLNAKAEKDIDLRNTLKFLSYHEKFLAGSWRFNTYFGRDTLLSLRMLMPVLRPVAVETGIQSVLTRLNYDGDVAHEEGIGEFAVIAHGAVAPLDPTPTYDYKMTDDDLLLAPVGASWLLDDPVGNSRAPAFLAASGEDGESNGVKLVRNLMFVIKRTTQFAENPVAANLVRIKDKVGNWRDSVEGLGYGVYPFDVNSVFAPAALHAAALFLKSGLLDPYLTEDQLKALGSAEKAAAVWDKYAPELFKVSIDASDARTAIDAYATSIGVPSVSNALTQDALVFNAVSLDDHGDPVRIANSDAGFALLFANPSDADLLQMTGEMTRRFPAGLMTDAGMVVANPVFANDSLKAVFTKNHYHGALVWSWQQALWISGINRQLQRTDLQAAARAALIDARQLLWKVVGNAKAYRSSELWSWKYENGTYNPVAFGSSTIDATESNAAQLWSTVYLALHAPTDGVDIIE